MKTTFNDTKEFQEFVNLLFQKAIADGLTIIANTPDGEFKVTGMTATEDELILHAE